MTPPEVLLAAARKAYPQHEWQLPERGRTWPFFKNEDGEVVVFTTWNDCMFDLQIALEDDWIFTRGKHGFQATKKDDSVILYGQNKPDLLLAIVREGV